ncbi:uncharacterized protein YebA [Filimonas sp.]|nr:uncharacterized protein YebA [Filimonas sp.]
MLAFFSIYKLLDNYALGEFDSFFISVQFMVFAYLFAAGWLCGWGLQRIRFFPVVLSGLLLILCLFLIAKTGNLTTPEKLIRYLSPVVLYSIYMIYTNESLRNTEHTSGRFWWRFSKRLFGFCALLFLLFGGILYLMYPEISARVEEYGGGGKDGENQMLETKKDGTVENKQSMDMGSNNKRDKNPDPLFCAHIDNFLPGSEIPNPLYLTSYHFTKFDTLTETFERDTTLTFSDEFQPDPSILPLFSTTKDSSRILNARSATHRKTVEVEIYKKRLSAKAFIAPSTSYWVQPITVEKEFQKEFSSAYRSKSYVSDLNSAYFIYNSDNPQIVQFQQHRFEELRKSKSYTGFDAAFMKYYTFFPQASQYRQIKTLADSLANGKTTVVDKVLSVRDYFLERNELGEKKFAYSDNPGVPGLPGASKLMYFLFESKKGYCAYYAGATVFLLRAMGIPSRIVTGFMTVDRSDKNTGWYWFYEDQSHGWVQVYFPEYGWIDFDTTIGNDDAQQSPTPDGTPPMQPPNPVLALGGEILSVDTLQKTAALHLRNLIFKDVEFKNMDTNISLDLKVANIWKDSVQLTIHHLMKGNKVMAVSYAEKLKVFSPEKSAPALLKKFPALIPMDEVYIKSMEEKVKKEEPVDKTQTRPFTYYLRQFAFILLTLFLLLCTIPILIYRWYKYKMRHARNAKEKAYYAYCAATFLLHQLGIERQQRTTWQFAKQVVDEQYGANFTDFMKVYLKTKYANQELNRREEEFIESFYPPFEAKIKSHFKIGKRIARFLNLNTFIRYYQLPEEETTA